MPMSFPDMESLRFAAEVWKFRAAAGEDEAAYRAAPAEPPISPHLAGWCGTPFR